MAAIVLGLSDYIRTLARTPSVILRNMYVEADPSNAIDGKMRVQRPGLTLFDTVGAGPTMACYQRPGVFGGDYLVGSAGKLYRVQANGTATLIGDLGSTARASIAASTTKAVIVNGGVPHSTDGTTLTAITMPDDVTVSSTDYIDGYFILTQTDSQRFYWLAPGDTNPDALNFASAENSPDPITRAIVLYDEIWFFGANSVEVWIPTGDNTLPFQRLSGRIYSIGCIWRDAIAIIDNTLFFPGSDGKVYRAGQNAPERVSDHAIEEAIRRNGSGTMSAWAFTLDGHAFYALTLANIGTFVLDIENSGWSAWDTSSRDIPTWRAHIGTDGNGAAILCGDDTTGRLYTLTQGQANDNGEVFVRELAGAVAVIGPPVRCNNIQVFASVGWSPDADLEPEMEFNWSDDQGQTFPGAWMTLSLGVQGDYSAMLYAQQLGVIYPPGRIFRFRMSDDANWRVSMVRMNEFR